jgi:pimeloyl-ACP methyl ester carboxylesterase
VNYRLGRALVLGQTHGHPTRLTPGYARSAIAAMGTCPGFDATLAATATRRCLATTPIDVPVTVAFGSRDVLLPRRLARHLDQLPPAAQEETLPGCGHVPMADDPAAVAALISRTAVRAGTRAGAGAGATGTGRTGAGRPRGAGSACLNPA